MEIARLDPYLVRWAASGAIALASDTVDIQILTLDAKELLDHKVKWLSTRHAPHPGARVIDMQWGPTLQSSEASCFLAYVLDSGECCLLDVANNEATLRQSFLGSFSAVSWQGPSLLLGTFEGEIVSYDVPSLTFRSKVATLDSPIKFLADSNGTIGAVTYANVCWVKQENAEMRKLETNGSSVNSLAFLDGSVAVCQPGQIQIGDATHKLKSFLPGDLIVHKGKAAFVHSDGTVSVIGELQFPTFEGDVIGCQAHPVLSMAIVVLGENTTGSQKWAFPILSGMSAKLAIFPLDDNLETPKRAEVDAPVAWLSAIAKHSISKSLIPGPPPLSNSKASSGTLVSALKDLFVSEWFDHARWRWYMEAGNRPSIEKEMKGAIFSLIQNRKLQSTLDKLVYSFYANEKYDGFRIHDDLLHDEFMDQLPGSTSFLGSPSGGVLCAQSGRIWKRCALTGLPLMTLDTMVSSDGAFVRYRNVPVLEGVTDSSKNEISVALLEAATFCIFTGTSWQKNI